MSSGDGRRLLRPPPVIAVGSLLVRRVFFAYVAAALLILAIQVSKEVHDVKEGIRRELEIQERAFQRPLASALWSLARQEMNAVVVGMTSVPLIAGVQLIDRISGKVIAQSGIVSDDGAFEIAPRTSLVATSPNVRRIHSFPVVYEHEAGREVVGTAVIYAPSDLLLNRLGPSLALLVVTALIRAAILWWLGLFFMRRLVQVPLTHLTQVAQRFDPEADDPAVSVSVLERKRTEISVLAEAFADLTERVVAGRRLRKEAWHLDMAEQVANLGHWRFDAASGRVQMSRQFRRMAFATGDGPAVIDAADWHQLWNSDDVGATVSTLAHLLAQDDEVTAEWRLRGGPPHRYMLVRVRNERDDGGRITGAFGVAVDITQRRHLEDELLKLAMTDALTGLPNRRAAMQALQRDFALAQRHGQPLSVLILDCDHFKAINDSFGHDAGDSVLASLALTMSQYCRKGDLAARFGGEEFVAIMPDTCGDGAAALAERLRVAVADTAVETAKGPIHYTVSIGVASLRPDILHHAQLLAEADAALYRAKQNGRNRVEARQHG